MTETLTQPVASNYINGQFVSIEGEDITSVNPARPDEIIWQGAGRIEHVNDAVDAAQRALPAWANAPIEERIAVLRRWQEVTTANVDRIAGLITDEMGKVLAESRFEASALAGKVDITLDDISFNRVRDYDVTVNETRTGHCRFKPHGVMAVIGPFNFPAHLANGHWVPALLMGNTIVFKPSEKTPAVGQLLAELMHESGVPEGVFNLVQGGPRVAQHLTTHDDVDGICFTGSWPVGRRILEANLDHPGRIVALEMGGNNASVVLDDAHLKQAVLECMRAAFATTGQRCTCTRRIIVQEGIAERFIAALAKAASTILIGSGRSEQPVFMGPIVSAQAAKTVLETQAALAKSGGRVMLEATRPDEPGFYVTPGIIEVDGFSLDRDEETFGPLVQICIVKDLDEAIAQHNATRYGLAGSIFTASRASFDQFFARANCGCINWNTGTAGASSKLPFGGLGSSGNHRPAGAFSVDYCAYPVANMIEQSAEAAVPAGVHWSDQWL